MAQSVQLDPRGPDWPIGLILVPVPGTPVGIMSLVDASSVNAPETLNPPKTGSVPAGSYEYVPAAQQIIFQAFKKGAGPHGLANNSGNIYIVRQGIQGTGNRDDWGSMVVCMTPGQTFILASAPGVLDVFNPYRYSIDADNANDGCLVTLIIQ